MLKRERPEIIPKSGPSNLVVRLGTRPDKISLAQHLVSSAKPTTTSRQNGLPYRPDPEGEPWMELGRRGAHAAARLPTIALARRRFERVPVSFITRTLTVKGCVCSKETLADALGFRAAHRGKSLLRNLFGTTMKTATRIGDCA